MIEDVCLRLLISLIVGAIAVILYDLFTIKK
jgi:hypothetical protein